MSHIKLANEHDVILVIPCTANFLAKISGGIADDLATNVILASTKKKIIAPAMNTNMWNNKVVKNNIGKIIKLGFDVYYPQSGKLACGTFGSGKLIEIESIINNLDTFFHEKYLSGVTAVVTSGPSIEEIDPVRYMTNYSSGKQGYAIAEELANAGAKTVLISGPSSLPKPRNVKTIFVSSAKEFLDQSLKNLPSEIFISVAAISDWKIEKKFKSKIKKKKETLTLKFTKNIDVLEKISTHKNRPCLVIGFSAETENLIKNAKIKLNKKKCDFIVANQVSKNKGFNSDKNKVFIIKKNNVEEWPTLKKEIVAKKLVKQIVSFFKKK